MEKTITYSKSYTLVLTHSCANNCLYCGFRNQDEGIVFFPEAEKIIKTAKQTGHWEILVISGENPQKIPRVSRELKILGYHCFACYTADICKLILKDSLLPHTNIGTLSSEDLTMLKKYNASMGLMLENINAVLGRAVHPQKDIGKRLKTIKDAGRLQIPFTTGILIGIGEKHKDRIDSLKEIINLHSTYNHIQEIIIQNFVPNTGSRIRISEQVSEEEYRELIEFVKNSSDIPVQIPENLNIDYLKMIEFGASDIGGVSEGKDHVNPDSRWEGIEEISKKIDASGYRLKGRLPLYEKYYQLGWYSEEVGKVIEEYLRKDEFNYYGSTRSP